MTENLHILIPVWSWAYLKSVEVQTYFKSLWQWKICDGHCRIQDCIGRGRHNCLNLPLVPHGSFGRSLCWKHASSPHFGLHLKLLTGSMTCQADFGFPLLFYLASKWKWAILITTSTCKRSQQNTCSLELIPYTIFFFFDNISIATHLSINAGNQVWMSNEPSAV